MLMKMTDEPDDYEGPWPRGDAMTKPTVDDVMRLATAYAGRYGTCPYDLMVEAREELRAVVESLIAAPAAPQQAEPVAQIGWADEFGNLFPMGAWKPAQRTHHDSHKSAWRPVFLHPPPAEVQRLRDALQLLLDKCDDSDDAQYSTLGTKFVRDIARRALEGGE